MICASRLTNFTKLSTKKFRCKVSETYNPQTSCGQWVFLSRHNYRNQERMLHRSQEHSFESQ